MKWRRLGGGLGHWFRKHQRTLREWLVLGAAVFAGVFGWQQISDERNARKQDEQQAALAARRSQAERISAWPAADTEAGTRVILANASQQPVYEAVVSRVTVQAAGAYHGRQLQGTEAARNRQTLEVVPPGRYGVRFPPGFAGMGRRPGVEIAFTDARGVGWVRSANGQLHELPSSAARYYGLSRPLYLQLPKPAR